MPRGGSIMLCSRCGNSIGENSRFCDRCG
ncbi:MAG: hypothetical protein DMG84_02455 [Acidobacteria bacterium]|nr:MAG: hypothetical protein DMG84_02455 [Acidobacteriota bacterium]